MLVPAFALARRSLWRGLVDVPPLASFDSQFEDPTFVERGAARVSQFRRVNFGSNLKPHFSIVEFRCERDAHQRVGAVPTATLRTLSPERPLLLPRRLAASQPRCRRPVFSACHRAFFSRLSRVGFALCLIRIEEFMSRRCLAGVVSAVALRISSPTYQHLLRCLAISRSCRQLLFGVVFALLVLSARVLSVSFSVTSFLFEAGCIA